MVSTNGNRALRLIVVDSDKAARDYIKRSLGDSGVRVVGEAVDLKAGQRLVRGLQPDVVLVELPVNATETVEIIRKLNEELPDTGIIISAHQPSPQLILGCMRAGAQEFVGRPLDVPEIDRAIDHVRKQLERTIASGRRRGAVISVFSSKGGIGATSVAANLGVALADRDDTKTVLVDLSFQMGDLALMLDQPPKYSLVDAFVENKLDEGKLRSILSHHSSGAYLLTVAASPELGEELTRHHMVEMFGSLNNLFDYVIVDVGRQLDDRTVEVLDLSDAIVMVSMQDIPTIRNISRYLDMFERLELEREKIHLVVNRFHKKSRLSLKDVEAALGLDTFWAIPNDFIPMSLGIDSGVPAVLEAPRSKLAQSFRDLADHFCGIFENQSLAEPIETTTNS